MPVIRPPVQIAYKIFSIDDVKNLSKIFTDEAQRHGLRTSFKVQFAENNFTKIESDNSIFEDREVVDRELNSIEMTMGDPEQTTYAKLVLNHGSKDGSYLECGAKDTTWAGGFEDLILRQITQVTSQVFGKQQVIFGLFLFCFLTVFFTYFIGNALESLGITKTGHTLLTSRSAIRFIPDSYKPLSYFWGLFVAIFIAYYLLNKLEIIFPVIDLRIGKKRVQRFSKIISIGKWFLNFVLIPFSLFVLDKLYENSEQAPPTEQIQENSSVGSY